MGCCHRFGNVEQLSASWFSAIAGLGWFGRLEAWRRSYTDVTCGQANLSLFTLSGSNLLHTLTILLRPVPQAQRGLKSRLMQKGVCRETIPHRKKRTLPSLQRSGPWCNELSCQLLYPESTSHLEQELNRNAIPQPSAMEWLQKYRQEYAAAPYTVQQLLAFARNRGGSLSFSEAQRLFHQGLHLKPEEEQEEPSEHPWLHPWLQSSDAELASAPCRLVGLLSLRAVSSHHKLGGIMFCECRCQTVGLDFEGFAVLFRFVVVRCIFRRCLRKLPRIVPWQTMVATCPLMTIWICILIFGAKAAWSKRPTDASCHCWIRNNKIFQISKLLGPEKATYLVFCLHTHQKYAISNTCLLRISIQMTSPYGWSKARYPRMGWFPCPPSA